MRTTHGNAFLSAVQGHSGPVSIRNPIANPIHPWVTGPVTLLILPKNQPKHCVKRPSKGARTIGRLMDFQYVGKRHDDSAPAPGDPVKRPPPFPKGVNLISPDTRQADCEAWKAADHHYSINRDRLSPLYRAAWPRPKMSTYDVFMKYAVPHILRGLRAPDFPDPNHGLSVHKQIHYTDDDALNVAASTLLPIPDSCQCFGFHHARVWLCQVRRKDPPDSPTFYLYWYIAEFGDYNRLPGTRFYLCHRLQYSPDRTDVSDWYEWWPYTNYTTCFSAHDKRIHGVQLLAALPVYTAGGAEADPPQIDPESILGINTLVTNEPFHHWPRKRLSKRRDTYWYNTTDDTTPPTPWSGYHWKPY